MLSKTPQKSPNPYRTGDFFFSIRQNVALDENRSMSHARGGTQCGEGCGEDGDNQLNDSLPGFFVLGHNRTFLSSTSKITKPLEYSDSKEFMNLGTFFSNTNLSN